MMDRDARESWESPAAFSPPSNGDHLYVPRVFLVEIRSLTVTHPLHHCVTTRIFPIWAPGCHGGLPGVCHLPTVDAISHPPSAALGLDARCCRNRGSAQKCSTLSASGGRAEAMIATDRAGQDK